MCCACGGGNASVVEILPNCVDIDDGSTDTDGYGCMHYARSPLACSIAYKTKSASFNARQLCCACGGGQPFSSLRTASSTTSSAKQTLASIENNAHGDAFRD